MVMIVLDLEKKNLCLDTKFLVKRLKNRNG